MKCRRMLLVAIPLLFSAAMLGCSSKIKVMIRDSVTLEPVIGARVRASRSVILQIGPHRWDDGITNKDGIVILHLVEAGFLSLTIWPYYSLESMKKSVMLWRMPFGHPARYGNTDWVQLGREVLSNIDPKIEYKLEKYVENDDKGRSKDNK